MSLLILEKKTNQLISTLHSEDMVIQTEDFVSPIKWHLGHTTWFFSKILLVHTLRNIKFWQGI